MANEQVPIAENSPTTHPFLTKRKLETRVDTVETEGVNEVEMKDAESIDVSREQGIKEVEMQDAEIMNDDRTHLEDSTREEGLMRPDISNGDRKLELNAGEEHKDDQDIKEIEKPTKVEASENDEKGVGNEETKDGSGQRVLGEVATLLKQVEESDAKAKLEVEVKVKKLDHEGVKENGEVNESQNTARGSCT